MDICLPVLWTFYSLCFVFVYLCVTLFCILSDHKAIHLQSAEPYINFLKLLYPHALTAYLWEQATLVYCVPFPCPLFPYAARKPLYHTSGMTDCKSCDKWKKSRYSYHPSHENKNGQLTPTHSPTGLRQLADWCRRQQPAHWVISAIVGGEAPQTLCRQNTTQASSLCMLCFY